MVLLMISLAHTEWRWADDDMEFAMDKKAHLIGSFGLYYLFRHKEFNETQSILYSLSLGLLKETSDALLPHKKYGRMGGDGFSKYDLDKAWNPGEKKNDIQCRLSRHSFLFTFRIY